VGDVWFAAYLLLWTVAVSAALTNACDLGLSNLTGGAIAQPWGGVLYSLVMGLLAPDMKRTSVWRGHEEYRECRMPNAE